MAFVTLEKQGHVGIVTINRPEALNALSPEVFADLGKTVDQLEADDDIYVVVLTGAGRSFVAGADIGVMLPMTPVEGKAWSDKGNKLFLRVENLEKPVIAAVNGFALGGGCELAMSCDIRIASDKAKFGQPEVGLGVTPGFGGTQRLPRIVGFGHAMELALSGKLVSAQEAKEIGLVNRVVSSEELMPACMELANLIAAQAPVAVRETKRAIRKGMQTDIYTGAAYEAEAFGLCFSTQDQTEGMTAFVDKRAEKKFIGK